MKIKVRKGDNVKILAGRDRGKTGVVEKVLAKENRLVVTGLNIVKKHVRPRGRQNPHGGIINLPAPVPIARVMVICPRCQKPTRVKIQLDLENQRQRQCAKCHETWQG